MCRAKFLASFRVTFVSLLVHSLLLHYAQGVEIIVCPESHISKQNCSSGMDINEALTNIMKSLYTNVTVILLPGIHFLSEFIPLQNLTEVRIIGAEPTTTLTCQDTQSGFFFHDVQNLTMENLTVNKCGISGQNSNIILSSIRSELQDGLFDFKLIFLQSEIGLFLVNCQDVSIVSVTVQNTNGIGLFGINVIGLKLEKATFKNNKCDQTTSVTLGGGVTLLYLDYRNQSQYTQHQVPQITAKLSNCTFINNTDCSSDDCTSKPISSDCSNQYRVGGGGGLTIVLSQLNYDVNVVIQSTLFEQNYAEVGGGVYLGTFSGVSDSSITISDCQFDQNGNSLSAVGGIMASTNLPYPANLQEQMLAACNHTQGNYNTIAITIVNSTFTNNAADIAGGAHLRSFSSTKSVVVSTVHVLVDHCLFEGNNAHRISALAVHGSQESLDIDKSAILLQVVLKASNFTQNFLNLEFQMVYEYSATVGIGFVNNITLEGIAFLNNTATGLHALRSTIYMGEQVTFSNNFGFGCGGGLKLTDSFLILNNNSKVSFTDNTARVAGGGICVDHIMISELETWGQPKVYDCFVYCTSLRSLNCNNPKYDAVLIFRGNSAPSGCAIFGINVNGQCQNLLDGGILHLNNETTSTTVNRIEILDLQRLSKTSLMPGDTLDIRIAAYDYLNYSVSGITFSYSYSVGDSRISDMFHNISDIYMLPTMPSSISVIVNGEENTHPTVTVWLQSSLSSLHFTTFTVTLAKCRPGFQYNNESHTCNCDERLENIGIQCGEGNGFLIPKSKWFGPLEHDDENKTSINTDLLLLKSCPLNYCNNNSVKILLGDYNHQCKRDLNRDGLLCGTCKENFSVTLGTNQCRECSDYNLFLIVLFLLFGVLVVVTMAKLRATVTEGFLNPVLFYCNVANYLSAYLIPGVDYNWILILAGVLSFKPKLSVCLYDGMDSLQYFVFQYAFVLYIYALLGIVLLLVRLKVISTYSPVKLFTTLLLLCYSSVIELCTNTIALKRVQTLGGTVYWRWYIDPTVNYGQGLHLLLLIIAFILMIIYVIPTTFLTLFPQRVYNIRYVGRLKPLYDALWAPFKPQYRWWFGFHLLLRWVIMIISTFLQFAIPSTTFALVIILIVLLYIHIVFYPYQGTWQNRTESFLLTNLVLLLIGALCFENADISSLPGQIIYSGILVTIAYLLFLGLLLGHLCSNFIVCVKEVFTRFKLKKRRGYTLQPVQQDSSSESSNDEEETQSLTMSADASVQVGAGELNLWQQESVDPEHEELELRFRMVTFSEFREPLLDEGEAEMTAFATLKQKVKKK